MKTSLALAPFLALGLCGLQAALLPSPKSSLECVPIDGWNVLVSYYNGHSFAERRDYKKIIGTTYSDIAPNSPEADALFKEFGDVLGEFALEVGNARDLTRLHVTNSVSFIQICVWTKLSAGALFD